MREIPILFSAPMVLAIRETRKAEVPMSDTSWTEQPACPYCGYVQKDAWEINFGGMEGDIVQTFAACEEDYSLSRGVTIDYSSEPLKLSLADRRSFSEWQKKERRVGWYIGPDGRFCLSMTIGHATGGQLESRRQFPAQFGVTNRQDWRCHVARVMLLLRHERRERRADRLSDNEALFAAQQFELALAREARL